MPSQAFPWSLGFDRENLPFLAANVRNPNIIGLDLLTRPPRFAGVPEGGGILSHEVADNIKVSHRRQYALFISPQ